jgi:hypothetical protein
MITLFSLLNGDSMLDIFNHTVDISMFWGLLYLYTFIVLFICVVHNIFI